MMQWLIPSLILFALAHRSPDAPPPQPAGRWMLESTHPLSQVSAVATCDTPGIWAAASAYEAWLFQDGQPVANSPLRARSGLQITQGGTQLDANGACWSPGKEYAIASPPAQHLHPGHHVASALILPGDSLMAAFARGNLSKGLAMPGESAERPTNPVLILDYRSGATLHTLIEDLPFAETLPFAANGHLLACAHDRLHVWDTRTGASLCDTVIPGAASIQQIAFSPDGSFLATAARHSGAAVLWDAETWKPVWKGKLLPGITRIAFGPQPGQFFFSTSRGLFTCTLQAGSKAIVPVAIATGEVLDFALSADGQRIYAAGGEKVRVYRLV